jgi:glycosyltransferase involved in cell wall biosynthesis
MLLLGNPESDIRVIKTVRSLQDAGYRVSLFSIGPEQLGTTPDLHGARLHLVHAPRPLRMLSGLRARLRRPSGQAQSARSNPVAATAQHGVLGDLRALGGTLWLNLVLALHAASHPAEIVHANDLDTLPAALLLKLRGARAVIYDAHELYPDMHSATSALYAGLWRLIEHRLIRHANAVITVNAAIAGELQRRHRLGRTPAVVMNCPVRVAEHPLTTSASGDAGVPMLFHGALQPERGLEEVITAMPLLDERISLAVRGDGPLRAHLEELAVAKGVSARVHFLPRVPPDRLIAELDGFSIGLVPYPPVSLNNYLCSPNKLFEYMMGGLAVLASDVPELRRILTETGAGLLYQTASPQSFAQAVMALAGDPDRLARCRRAARRAAEDRYNWEQQVIVLLAVYAGVVSVADS